MQADLHELFAARRNDRGALHAHWRLYHDVASLWLQRGRRCRSQSLERRSRSCATRALTSVCGAPVRATAGDPSARDRRSVTGAGHRHGCVQHHECRRPARRGTRRPGPRARVLRTTDRSVSTDWTYDEFLRLREGATRMQVEAVLTDTAPVARPDQPTPPCPLCRVAFVSGGFFAATGGRMTLGRPLEARRRAAFVGPPPVVVSFIFWTSRLNRDPAVVGRTIRSAALTRRSSAWRRGASLCRTAACSGCR